MSAPPLPSSRSAARPVELAGVLLVFSASLVPFFAFGLAGWPGEINGCIGRGTCFCEAFRAGLMRQPANTLSNLGFMAAALGIALHSQRARRRPAERRNRMTTTVGYPALYAATVAFLGPGSMFLHASMTRWGGQVDVISMYVWAAFLIAYAAARWRDVSWSTFLAIYLVLAIVLSISELTVPVSSNVIFGVLLGAAALLEVAALWSHSERTTDKRWLLGASACFGLAFAIWLPSRTPTGALCSPYSLLQGHAASHLLFAGATVCLYLYARSERA